MTSGPRAARSRPACGRVGLGPVAGTEWRKRMAPSIKATLAAAIRRTVAQRQPPPGGARRGCRDRRERDTGSADAARRGGRRPRRRFGSQRRWGGAGTNGGSGKRTAVVGARVGGGTDGRRGVRRLRSGAARAGAADPGPRPSAGRGWARWCRRGEPTPRARSSSASHEVRRPPPSVLGLLRRALEATTRTSGSGALGGRRERHGVLHVLQEHGHRGVGGERHPAGEHLIGDDAERVDVARRSNFAPVACSGDM